MHHSCRLPRRQAKIYWIGESAAEKPLSWNLRHHQLRPSGFCFKDKQNFFRVTKLTQGTLLSVTRKDIREIIVIRLRVLV